MNSKRGLFNSIAFTAAWWGIVKAAEWRNDWMLWFVFVGYFILHGRYFVSLPLLASTLIVATLGYIMDAGLQGLGVFFVRDSFWSVWPPLWLFLMWILFVSSLPASMQSLRGKWVLSALFGGFGGFLSYWAGTQFGLLSFGIPKYDLGMVGELGQVFGLNLSASDFLAKAALFFCWVLIFPIFLELQNRIQVSLEVKNDK